VALKNGPLHAMCTNSHYELRPCDGRITLHLIERFCPNFVKTDVS
jgi:hypothetical protein